MRSRDLLQFDLAVFCVAQTFSADEIFTLKGTGIHVLSFGPGTPQRGSLQAIPDFIHVPGIPYDLLLKVNLVANDVTNRLRKKFHLVLSELAADSYDNYGTFATKEVMRFEDDILRETIDELLSAGHGKLAIDVGCGNGRHSRVLAKRFEEVIAFDLSHRMVEAARAKDRRHLGPESTPVTYYECDVEYEQFPEEDSIKGRADFVCASFGMPSFVEDTAGFVRRVYRWLKPRGQALFTFYNSQSLALGVETPWRDRALSAAIDVARHALEIELRSDVRFSIYCRPLDERVRDIAKTCFNIRREASFPHVISILPPSVFGSDDRPRNDARELFSRIDRAIAWQKEFSHGHYVFLILEKLDARQEGFLRTLDALEKSGLQYEFIDHAEVVSVGDVQRLLRINAGSMIKTVVFKRTDSGQFLISLVLASSRVDVNKLAQAAGTEPDRLVLAPAQEVESRFGFPVGGIAPLGYEPSVPVFVDESLQHIAEQSVYMGAGANTKTLRMTREAFAHLVESYNIVDLAER